MVKTINREIRRNYQMLEENRWRTYSPEENNRRNVRIEDKKSNSKMIAKILKK
jgi:hypothetical protein